MRWPEGGGSASLAGDRVLESFLEEILVNLFTGRTEISQIGPRECYLGRKMMMYLVRYRVFNSPEPLCTVSELCSALRGRKLWDH